MKVNLPFMKLFPADYVVDTQHLKTKEHGAYLLLMMAYWARGGGLPDDDDFLARVTKTSKREWKAMRPVIEDFFTVDDEFGLWLHKRIEIDLAEARERSSGASKAGKESAKRRKQGFAGKRRRSVNQKDKVAQTVDAEKPNENNESGSTSVERTYQRNGNGKGNVRSTHQSQNISPLPPLGKPGSKTTRRAPAPSDGQGGRGEAKPIGDVLEQSGVVLQGSVGKKRS